MLFQTPEFLVLFLVVLAFIAFVRQARAQHIFLIITSCVFYGWWDVRFLFLILLSTVIDYTAALGIGGVKLSGRKRAGSTALMVGSTLLLLGLNWPALQQKGLDAWAAAPFVPWNEVTAWTIGLSLAFSIIGPLLYPLYFRLDERRRKRAFLVTSLVANLGVLGFFKYFNFFADSIVSGASRLGMEWAAPSLVVALPVGISFYTFQTMSYTIDVYRGQIAPERSFVKLGLFVSYFPQLVAGPIIRPQQFLPSLERAWGVTGASMRSGMNLVLVGLFKKVLIADNVAPLADSIFATVEGQPSIIIMLGVALFAVQIYCDFSGYTDIARGISRVFGVEIPLNFNYPYFSTSIIEFWRRWHISLSTWLRDYLYIPLGGSRVSGLLTYFNLMVTMVLGGLWHGASWNFVIWGAYQGVLLCVNRLFRAIVEPHKPIVALLQSRPGTVIRWGITLYFWMLGWLIFRLTDFDKLIYCVKKFVLFDGAISFSGLGLGRGSPATAALAILMFVALHTYGFMTKRWDERLTAMSMPLRLLAYVIIGMLLFYGWPSQQSAFIYFQF